MIFTNKFAILIKRLQDLTVSSLLLLASCPLLLFLAFGVLLFLGRPILFQQQRPGLKGQIFNLYKFRTMTDARDASGNLLPDAKRMHLFGRFMRSTSLDELPSLYNVLRGDMSLVGPRPLLIEYLPLYSHEQARRHDVKPGITGWAQINGRNLLSWEEKFELDVWYVDNWSLELDMKILCNTLSKVVAREGISQKGHVSMTKFTGTQVENEN